MYITESEYNVVLTETSNLRDDCIAAHEYIEHQNEQIIALCAAMVVARDECDEYLRTRQCGLDQFGRIATARTTLTVALSYIGNCADDLHFGDGSHRNEVQHD